MTKYKQKLREVWLHMPEFRAWLRRDPEDSYRAHCRFCKCGVNTKMCDLRAHALTKKHKKMKASVESRRNDSSNEEDDPGFEDHSTEYKYKPKAPRPKRPKTNSNSTDTTNNIKTENRNSNGPDYEAIIEGLALYEPEQVLFSNGSTLSDDQIVKSESQINMDEEIISNAVTAAVRNLKDSAQIFGDFVADRLRQLSEKTSELTKDKLMQVLLEAASLDRSTTDD
ncbi:uncharacterized protein LOC6567789 [Drosophila grimshawi]|uniref:GH19472 n=1 Tax=Drosophila grimshawi TaxID=7222 RepID=B4JRU9_DROGR|nr:uncharacterized protein LOC6567789 [Drosophila grimshawi]EDV94489.1 GH19472 [Drosophila grimshawi]